MSSHRFVQQLARGLASGLVGTAAMTAVQSLDAKLSGREPSTTPAKAVEKLLRIEPRSEAAEMRLTTATHWAYGTAWGAARSALAMVAPNPVTATTAHFLAVWGAAFVNVTALGLAPPPTQWAKKTLAKDALYHATYAVAAGVTYELLPEPS